MKSLAGFRMHLGSYSESPAKGKHDKAFNSQVINPVALATGLNISSSIDKMGIRPSQPSIYLYADTKMAINLRLKFKNKGFMTMSIPSYNDGWRVLLDPNAPYYKISLQYNMLNEGAISFLDYDGIRIGEWQEISGWQIKSKEFTKWIKKNIYKIKLNTNEEDDFLYWVSRIVAESIYYKNSDELYLNIYPQLTNLINESVALNINPIPDNIWRIWLYITTSSKKSELKEPEVPEPLRKGFHIIETGILTDFS